MFLTNLNYRKIRQDISNLLMEVDILKNKVDYGCIYPYQNLYGSYEIKVISPRDHLNVGEKEVCFNGYMYPISSYFAPAKRSWEIAEESRKLKPLKEKK